MKVKGPRSGKYNSLLAASRQVESRFGARIVSDLAVQVTSAGESFPHRRDSMLPTSHPQVRGAAVLDEDKSAVWFHNAPDFVESESRIIHGAQASR